MKDFIICPATIDDKDYIAEGILSAVGDDLSRELGSHIKPGEGSAKDLFAEVASMSNSQYSYRNALIAKDMTGKRAGVVIAYDGAMLHDLRQAFVKEFNKRCGTNYSEKEWDDETSDDEIYIDTLYVDRDYRQKGIGTLLIRAVESKYEECGKPFGLLCALDNNTARKLYTKLGYKDIGTRRFAGEKMAHLRKDIKN